MSQTDQLPAIPQDGVARPSEGPPITPPWVATIDRPNVLLGLLFAVLATAAAILCLVCIIWMATTTVTVNKQGVTEDCRGGIAFLAVITFAGSHALVIVGMRRLHS